MDFASIISIATSVSPIVATVLLSVISTIALMKKDVASLNRRIESIEHMELSSRLAKIESDISWIRAKLEGKL